MKLNQALMTLFFTGSLVGAAFHAPSVRAQTDSSVQQISTQEAQIPKSVEAAHLSEDTGRSTRARSATARVRLRRECLKAHPKASKDEVETCIKQKFSALSSDPK